MARGEDSAHRRGAGAARPLRPPRLLPTAHRMALRLPLPDRDLHPGREAGPRILRPALPPRRSTRRTRRPPPRSGGRGPPRPPGDLGARRGALRRARGGAFGDGEVARGGRTGCGGHSRAIKLGTIQSFELSSGVQRRLGEKWLISSRSFCAPVRAARSRSSAGTRTRSMRCPTSSARCPTPSCARRPTASASALRTANHSTRCCRRPSPRCARPRAGHWACGTSTSSSWAEPHSTSATSPR
ncbi:Uncharacterised protein [Mycobacteroides abscessus subsp. abscessus]|nr:Uncharacterised protein [Mycobacteroides abscessus subsp. abscessus]